MYSAPLPANGVLLFDSWNPDSASVTVTGPDGTVEGTLVEVHGYVAWRASTPPEPGAYEYLFSETAFVGGTPRPLEIVESYQPEPHELGLALLLTSKDAAAGEIVCCEPDAESRSLDHGCFYTQVTQQPWLTWLYASPLPPAHATQYLYRFSSIPTLARGGAIFDSYVALTSSSGNLAVVPADEYCVTLEALSLIDEQVFSRTVCIPHSLPEPELRPRTDYGGAFSISTCPEPPDGFEQTWCDTLGPGCTTPILNTAQLDEQIALCQPVYERCDLEPPAVVDAGPPIAVGDGGLDAGGDEAGPPSLERTTAPAEDPPTFACSCRAPSAAPSSSAPWSCAAAVLWAFHRRRARQGATRSPSR